MTTNLPLAFNFDLLEGIENRPPDVQRYLSDLKGYFLDDHAYDAQLSQHNPLIYEVTALSWHDGRADLVCGFGKLMPGKIGDEYYLTKGHYHTRREAAEIYIGLSGTGYMLLEDEKTEDSQWLVLKAGSIVYVPGYTAHRTVNTGDIPLTYLGINVADAGHDYGSIATRNFLKVIIEENGIPALLHRKQYLAMKAK